METWQTQRGITFHYNKDFNADVIIQDEHGAQMAVPSQDILDFVAWMYVARQKIARIEQCTTDEILLNNADISGKRKPMESR